MKKIRSVGTKIHEKKDNTYFYFLRRKIFLVRCMFFFNLGKKELSGLVKQLEGQVSKCRKMRASLAGDANLGPLKDGLQLAEENLGAKLDSYHETLAANQEENEATDTDLQAKLEEAKGNLNAIQTALKDAGDKLTESKKKAG